MVDDCWLCCHSQSPFNEGFAVDAEVIPTNNSRLCCWQTGDWNGLSLSQVSSLGLCVVGSDTPTQYTHLCNRTISPEKDSSYLLPQNDTWWICLDGLTPCLATEAFPIDSSDFCVLVQLVPQLVYYPSEEFFHLWDQFHDSSLGLSQQRCKPISAITVSVLLGLGAVGAGTGISSLFFQTATNKN